MLVLSRKQTERIVINGDVTVTVVEISGNKVRIGIDAPGEVPVHRMEVADAISAGQGEKSSDLNDHRLLVVSKDRRTRSSVAGILAEAGGDVDTADSSARALCYIEENEYDFAILDESLGRESGQELFERIKRRQSDLKGILCSEFPTVATVEAAIDSGMEHVVKRPVNQAELRSLVIN